MHDRSNTPLLQHLCGYVNGEWRHTTTGSKAEVRNPATGDVLAELPMMGAHDANDAIVAAETALEHAQPPDARRRWLIEVADRLLEHRDALGRIITLENGKPLREGVSEVEYAAGFFQFTGTHLDSLSSHTLSGRIRGCDWTIHHRPAGVAALITPWNLPLAMLAKKLAAAIAAGCTIVAKPAPQTPLSAIALWHIFDQLDLPSGQVNLLIGEAGPIGEVFCSHPAVRVISFTGSTDVGKLLIAKTAPHIKRLTLELGGNAPFVVCDDADLPAATEALLANKFRAGGQTCVCANRVLVHQRVVAEFSAMVAERVGHLRIGDGCDQTSDIGPLIDRPAYDKVARHVSDAMKHGARRLVGKDMPRPAHNWGAFFAPSVLTDVRPPMLICTEETFGPVVAIASFHDHDEMIAECNRTRSGLAAYLFTQDLERAEPLIARLRFGHVGLNNGNGPTPEAPFGGMQQSGFGREGGVEGILDFCETQVVARA